MARAYNLPALEAFVAAARAVGDAYASQMSSEFNMARDEVRAVDAFDAAWDALQGPDLQARAFLQRLVDSPPYTYSLAGQHWLCHYCGAPATTAHDADCFIAQVLAWLAAPQEGW